VACFVTGYLLPLVGLGGRTSTLREIFHFPELLCVINAHTPLKEKRVKPERINTVVNIKQWEQVKLEAVRRRCTDEEVVKDAIQLATGHRDMLLDTLRKRLENAAVEKAGEEQEVKRIAPRLSPETATVTKLFSSAIGMSAPEFIKLSLDVYFDHKEEA
jgi:hypothetical protein